MLFLLHLLIGWIDARDCGSLLKFKAVMLVEMEISSTGLFNSSLYLDYVTKKNKNFFVLPGEYLRVTC